MFWWGLLAGMGLLALLEVGVLAVADAAGSRRRTDQVVREYRLRKLIDERTGDD